MIGEYLTLLSSSCCFLDVIPYGILSHALVAFSMQAKNAEVVINCVTRVYDFLLNQHGKVLQNAVLDLFKVSPFSFHIQYHVDCICKFFIRILPLFYSFICQCFLSSFIFLLFLSCYFL